MIAIVDYGRGNLRSVEKAFKKLAVNVVVTSSAKEVLEADAIVLPGVGAFKDCIQGLKDRGLIEAVYKSIDTGKPYLGICLGLQILFSGSEEFGYTEGLDIIKGRVVRFPSGRLKVPHMGWNRVYFRDHNCKLFEGIINGSFFYFVHSYYVKPEDEEVIAATTEYGVEFVSAIQKDNIMAVQFHPEKSQKVGLRLLENFSRIVKGLEPIQG